MICLRPLALWLLVLGLTTSASAGPTWWDEVNDRSNSKADLMKKTTPWEALEDRMQRNMRSLANRKASRAEWDAEVESAAASRTPGRAVNACIARGGRGHDCMDDPSSPPAPRDHSYVMELFSPQRVEEFRNITRLNAQFTNVASGSTAPGTVPAIQLSVSTTELPKAQEGSGWKPKCGAFYGDAAPPPAPDPDGSYSESIDRFYAKHPYCPRPASKAKVPYTGGGGVIQE